MSRWRRLAVATAPGRKPAPFGHCLMRRAQYRRHMKVQTNLTLDSRAVAAGERLVAAGVADSLSAVVEKQLLARAAEAEEEHFSRHHGRPAPRPGDPRYEYLVAKHGVRR